jgi:hypothetical protein
LSGEGQARLEKGNLLVKNDDPGIFTVYRTCGCGSTSEKIIKYEPDKISFFKIKSTKNTWYVYPQTFSYTFVKKKPHISHGRFYTIELTTDCITLYADGRMDGGKLKTKRHSDERRVMLGGHFGAFVKKKGAYVHKGGSTEPRFFHRHWGDGYVPILDGVCPECQEKPPANAKKLLELVEAIK